MFRIVALLLALIGAASAQVSMTGAGKGAPGGGVCAQYTSFINRTSGTSATEKAAYQTMICGMVSDGTWSSLDALYIFATNTTTTAGLNLVSTSYTLTVHGTLTFTADSGWLGDGSTGFLDTGMAATAAGLNFTQNSATVGLYDLASGGQTSPIQMGEDAATNFDVNFGVMQTAAGGRDEATLTSTGQQTTADANTNGSYLLTRTGSASTTLYRNGSSFATLTSTSGSLSNCNIYIFADNGSSCPAGSAGGFASDKLSAAFIGGGLNSTQAGKVQSRINAYMTALGINVY